MDEGVIQFRAAHHSKQLGRELGDSLTKAVAELSAWQRVLSQLKLVGQCPDLYGGLAFGNLSARMTPTSAPQGRRRFLITGTQRSGRDTLSVEDYALVHSYSLASNEVRSEGMTLPSSESLTHAAIYDLSPAIRFVFHGHSSVIWRAAHALRLPTTASEVGYGTQAMGQEVQRLYRETALSEQRVLSMGGHEDGVVAFGRTASEAGLALIEQLACALESA